MSDGLRSLFYISLVDSILDVENQIQQQLESDPEHASFNRTPPILTIVAIEEPENHIAPHLLGKIIDNLQSIANKRNAQTIMTSHSPAIVKRIDPESLRYFRLSSTDKTTCVRGITLPDNEKFEAQYKYIKEAVRAYPELYFANLVILGEGDSEEILLPKFWEISKGKTDLSGVSIVPLGGKHVNHFWRLLNDLQIPHVTLLDLDREREGGGWGRIEYVLTQLLMCGYKREELLKTTDGVMTDEQLNQMHDYDINATESMQSWINRLEQFDVFFSAPLDIDFLMLEHFGEEYKQSISETEGPRISINTEDGNKTVFIKDIESTGFECPEYTDRTGSDVRRSLKECGGNGSTYSLEQKQLLIWYNYFFLNRGKPSTHFSVLASIEKEQLKRKMPPVFARLISQVERKISGDLNENNTT